MSLIKKVADLLQTNRCDNMLNELKKIEKSAIASMLDELNKKDIEIARSVIAGMNNSKQ